jgi:hypothetical protein
VKMARLAFFVQQFFVLKIVLHLIIAVIMLRVLTTIIRVRIAWRVALARIMQRERAIASSPVARIAHHRPSLILLRRARKIAEPSNDTSTPLHCRLVPPPQALMYTWRRSTPVMSVEFTTTVTVACGVLWWYNMYANSSVIISRPCSCRPKTWRTGLT